MLMEAWVGRRGTSLRQLGPTKPGDQHEENTQPNGSERKVQQALATLTHHIPHGQFDETGS